jgi:hypothetical protein
VCDKHRPDAPAGLLTARAAVSIGKCSSAQGEARRELCRLGRIALAGAAQAQWIVIGVEVWHVREPPYRPDKKSARRIAADSSKRL